MHRSSQTSTKPYTCIDWLKPKQNLVHVQIVPHIGKILFIYRLSQTLANFYTCTDSPKPWQNLIHVQIVQNLDKLLNMNQSNQRVFCLATDFRIIRVLTVFQWHREMLHLNTTGNSDQPTQHLPANILELALVSLRASDSQFDTRIFLI